jgi:outer membrane protein OmpA-like peptidoglycan-associated protein
VKQGAIVFFGKNFFGESAQGNTLIVVLFMNRLVILFCSLCLVAAWNPLRSVAQQNPPPKPVSFGVFGAVNFNQHRAGFRELPGIPTTNFSTLITRPQNDEIIFGDANGWGFTAGALADIPLADQLALSLRLSYATHNAQLFSTENLRVAGLSANGNDVAFADGIVRRELTPNLGTIGLEPMLAWSPIASATGFRLFVGARVGFMMQRSFLQVERLTEPTDPRYVWNNGLIERNRQEAEIPQAQLLNVAAIGGLGYDIPLGNIILSPEAFYLYSFTPFVNGLAWSANTIRGGFSLRYQSDPPPTPKPEDPPKKEDPPVAVKDTPKEPQTRLDSAKVEPPEEPRDFKKTPTFKHADENPKGSLNASIAAFMVDSNGVEQPLVRLKVEQFFAWQMYPLMNYIFFEQNAPNVPERYRKLKSKDETANFDEKDFHNVNMLRVYYDVMNIIGKRMRNIPNAKLELVGCNNNVGLEAGNIPLSFRRADEIRRYLIDIWEVDSARIIVRARNLPQKPTMSRDSLGIEENRRVEMYSDVWDILKPVLVSDTINVPEPPTIRFRMNIKADDGVARTTLNVKQGERALKLFSIPGKPDSTLDWNPIIDWNTINDQASAPNMPDDLKFGLDVVDKKGEEAHPSGAIPVELVTVAKKREAGVVDKQLAIYRLILFDFNSPSVGTNNARIINSFIMDNLDSKSKVDITGFTDKLGNPDVNMKLSSGRAKSVADFIKWRDTQFRGVGGTRPQYTNETPEGRIYNRSVEVRVETPVMLDAKNLKKSE